MVILLMHSRRWDNGHSYIKYIIEDVISKKSTLYGELYTLIDSQLGVDLDKMLKLEYKVEQSNTLMLKHNDMGVCYATESKKRF